MYYALIVAGGSGTRLWPLSRKDHPKQALNLVGNRSMFQQSVDRLSPLFKPEQILVVTRAEHVAILQSQTPELPQENFIIEPEGRGTAPAIGLAAVYLKKKDPQAVMAVLTADHHISKKEEFQKALEIAEKLAILGHLVTLGINPSFPSTGFGYIKQGKAIQSINGYSAFKVECFTEKPDGVTAKQMVVSGDYSWNSGMFVWRIDRILEEFKIQMPNLFSHLKDVESVLDTPGYTNMLKILWPQVSKETIDYGIMEKAKDVVVIPVDIGWTDVGSWDSLFDLLPKDSNRNIFINSIIDIDSHDNMVIGGKRLVSLIGIKDLVIIDSEDALLICFRGKEQEVKEMTEKIKKSQFSHFL